MLVICEASSWKNRWLAACQRALAIQPNSASALAQIGQCHMLQGDTGAAVSYFDRSLAIKPDDDAILSNRIFALDFSARVFDEWVPVLHASEHFEFSFALFFV